MFLSLIRICMHNNNPNKEGLKQISKISNINFKIKNKDRYFLCVKNQKTF